MRKIKKIISQIDFVFVVPMLIVVFLIGLSLSALATGNYNGMVMP